MDIRCLSVSNSSLDFVQDVVTLVERDVPCLRHICVNKVRCQRVVGRLVAQALDLYVSVTVVRELWNESLLAFAAEDKLVCLVGCIDTAAVSPCQINSSIFVEDFSVFEEDRASSSASTYKLSS